MGFLIKKMAILSHTHHFIILVLIQDLVFAGTFIPVPLEPTTTVHPSLYRNARAEDLSRYGLALPQSAVQLRNSRASQRCNRCDDWPPRRGEDRYDDRHDSRHDGRYNKDRYPDDERSGYESRPAHSTHDQDKDKYGNRNDDKGYGNRNDGNRNDDRYGNRNDDKGNKHDDRYQGSYGKPSDYDRNKSGSGVEEKPWSRPDTKFDNRNDDRRGGGNRNKYDDRDGEDRNKDRDRYEPDRYGDRDRYSPEKDRYGPDRDRFGPDRDRYGADRDRDRYAPSSHDREYDRGNGYDNRRPPPPLPHDDRYERRPLYEDRYERRPVYNDDRYDRRPYYPEDRYDRRPAYPDDRERDRGSGSGWQSYDRFGNRRPSHDDRRKPYEERYQDDYLYDRGTGYDNRPSEDRYRKQDSFRPWDETYRGTSGFDNSGRGYYFASGRPDVGASSAWGEGSGAYASGWQYGGRRGTEAGFRVGSAEPARGYSSWNEQSTPGGWRRPGVRTSASGDTSYLYDRPTTGLPSQEGGRNPGEEVNTTTQRDAKLAEEKDGKEDDSANDTGSKSL